ncbi:hypothetical protein WJX84_007685 [Apatococcus fuscideae]|uniref:V-type proton ATPase subunit G n=1 Tax=Apatococcus fuscideae TaxID=2026836 RepID=A0AAW1SUA0_9CHLO
MQISSGQDGIQRLLKAEQEAQAIVSKARKAKSDRLKQANQEAERDIKAFRSQQEEKYQKKISTDSTSSGDNEKRLETESSNDMRGIEKSIKEKKQQVIDALISFVVDVKLGKTPTQ